MKPEKKSMHSQDRAELPVIEELLAGNEQFRQNEFQKHYHRYSTIARQQHPKVLWIGCSDSRIQSGHITNAQPGMLFIHRNIGNIIPVQDWNFASVLEYAINHLTIEDIVICGHSDCGAIKALDGEMDSPFIQIWLNNALEAKERVDATLAPPVTPEEQKERRRLIEQENVRVQIEHLRRYPLVKKALAGKELRIHGLYYDLDTGILEKIR
ncbi:MAG: carbonic anhydrase [Methanoregula sp.]